MEDSGYIDLYFGDESHFGLVPCVPYAWQKKTAPILLPASRSRSLNVVGLMNRENDLFFEIHETTFNSEKAISFLDRFAQQIKKKTVIILDNAPIHKSKKFKAQIDRWEEMDLLIFFLPPYSPELNLIEILWKRMKYYWLPFEAYNNYSNLKENLNLILNSVGAKYDIKF